MRRRLATIVTLASLLVGLAVPATSLAADSAPLPTSIAAVGDSITQAASSGGSLGVDYPANSWSTGTNSTVQSHYLRLLAAGASIGNRVFNESVSGAKMVDLVAQMEAAAAHRPDYLTVLIGGNDLCTDTVGEMTDPGAFETQFRAAMDQLIVASPNTHVYVLSIPDVYQLWSLFRTNWWARVVWSAGDICQSLLANPTSTQQADVARRELVRSTNIAYNAALAGVCDEYDRDGRARCHHDGGAVFGTTFARSDVSGDYFHPSIAGQAKLASVSWAAGYAWGTANTAPTASFTFGCTDLACNFTDTSTDGDGTITERQWSFGDGNVSTVANPSHTYTAADTYTVTLTVTDDDGATAATSQQVTVTAAEEPPPPEPDGTMHVADLDGAATSGKGQAWTASVTIRVVDDTGVALPGATVTGSWTSGGTTTCTTNSAGSCTVSVSVNGKKATTTTYTVTDVVLAGYAYVAANNTDPDGDSNGTTIAVSSR